MRIVVGIQARMGSKRLPGKSLMHVCGKPLVNLVAERIRLSKSVSDIWVLTSTNPEDDALTEAIRPICHVLRGHDEDVQSRYKALWDRNGADLMVRITGDCPFMDGRLLDQLIGLHLRTNAEYSHILAQPWEPIAYPNGLNGEIFSRATFEKIVALSSTDDEKEHVTKAVFANPEKFQIAKLAPSRELSLPHWKLSIDTADDLKRSCNVYQRLGLGAEIADIPQIMNVLKEIDAEGL